MGLAPRFHNTAARSSLCGVQLHRATLKRHASCSGAWSQNTARVETSSKTPSSPKIETQKILHIIHPVWMFACKFVDCL